MDKWDSTFYIKSLDRCLQGLRSRCLGYDVPLRALLPEDCKALPPYRRAEQLARQILFQLAGYCSETECGEVERCWQWLYAMILYLFRNCSEDDHTVEGLVKLTELDYFRRSSMFQNFCGIDPAVWEDLTQPEPLAHLDIALLTMLDERGLLESGKTLNGRLEAMQQDDVSQKA